MCVLPHSACACCKTRAPALPKHAALLGSVRSTVCLSRRIRCASPCQVLRGRCQPFFWAWEQLVLNIGGRKSRSRCACGQCWPISLARAGVVPLALLPAGTCPCAAGLLGHAGPLYQHCPMLSASPLSFAQKVLGSKAALCAGLIKIVSPLDAQLNPPVPLLCLSTNG